MFTLSSKKWSWLLHQEVYFYVVPRRNEVSLSIPAIFLDWIYEGREHSPKSLSVSQVTSAPRLTPTKTFGHARCGTLGWRVMEIKSSSGFFSGDQNSNSTQALGWLWRSGSSSMHFRARHCSSDPSLNPPESQSAANRWFSSYLTQTRLIMNYEEKQSPQNTTAS